MRTRSKDRKRTMELVDSLSSLVERLRAGESLRQALTRSAGDEGSPFHAAAAALATGTPLARALNDAALDANLHASKMRSHTELASVFCVLAVHAKAGGDPLPAVRALSNRCLRRFAAGEEARAQSTQARIGARAILVLTPAFLLLVSLTDPHGPGAWFGQPRTRSAVGLGLMLQTAGAFWIRAIVGGVAKPESRSSRVPVVRAVRAMLTGRTRASTDADCAEAAELMAFSLDAGLSVSAALAAVAPFCPGRFGEALRSAVDTVGTPVHDAVDDAIAHLPGDVPRRFVRALTWSSELGVPLAPAMRALAGDVRDSTSVQLVEDTRRASMRVLIPLGVLVLPAFVLACLVPLFVGGLEGIAR